MNQLRHYNKMPIWGSQSVPSQLLGVSHTQAGEWAELILLKGKLELSFLDETGSIISTDQFSADSQPPLIEPQKSYQINSFSDDVECQLSLLCKPEDFYTKKYELTATHSEVLEATQTVPVGKVLDLGCGSGRNSLYLNQLGFDVDAYDRNSGSIANLNSIIAQEKLKNLRTAVYDINQAAIADQYDFIVSTVVFMFLQEESVPSIIKNMQESTKIGGYNLIVSAVETPELTAEVPFTFTFKAGELSDYYKGWELLKYNENLGELHRTDAQGNRIKMRFATLLARKV